MEPVHIAKIMGPTWDPPGSCRPQMGPMLAPWTMLSGRAIAWLSGAHEVIMKDMGKIERNPTTIQHNQTMLVTYSIFGDSRDVRWCNGYLSSKVRLFRLKTLFLWCIIQTFCAGIMLETRPKLCKILLLVCFLLFRKQRCLVYVSPFYLYFVISILPYNNRPVRVNTVSVWDLPCWTHQALYKHICPRLAIDWMHFLDRNVYFCSNRSLLKNVPLKVSFKSNPRMDK